MSDTPIRHTGGAHPHDQSPPPPNGHRMEMVQRVTRLEEWRAREERRRDKEEKSDSEGKRTLISWQQVVVAAILFGLVRWLSDLLPNLGQTP
ncbi:MAG: hypothetical protein F4123_08555 [Gemmatimonadetes bacterium]|nr:hypothetical protein [Gemmatimonadota bacterium]MYB99696.1 hypothetical protein [Gemmatimonadota bacterium]MYI46404.1 hypothetical protein [Gemmatimonadota bacterium]